MKKTVICLLAAFALAAIALAADATGKWSGSFSMAGGGESRTAYAILKQAGTTLTGTAGPSSDEQWPIENGKVEGNKITFAVSAPDGGVYRVQLTVEGDKANGDLTAVIGDQTVKGTIGLSRVK